MGVLTEYLKTEAEHLRKNQSTREHVVEEWVASIKSLYERLEKWLREADSGLGFLHLQPMNMDLEEPRLGLYNAPCLRVRLGTAVTLIAPRGRYVISTICPPGEETQRTDGAVEIKSGALAEHYLYRLAGSTPSEDRWFIRNVAIWNADPMNLQVEPLDRDRFEAAILRALR